MGPSAVGRRPRALAVALAVSAMLMGGAGAAEAHDELIGTSPAAGSSVAVVPARVTLTLSQPALAVGTLVIVKGPDGPVQTGKARLVDNTVTQRLRPGSPAGRYTVAWRTTSSDGHPVSGTFSFTAAKASPGVSTPATSPAPTSPTTSAPSATSETPTTPAVSTPASSTPADTTGSSSGLWWVLAGAVAVLLLLAGFVLARKPRSTPAGERDPRS
jgi:LPXTG-motif cell wall-anchored protein